MGRWLMECMPRMADWGGLMMGVDSRGSYVVVERQPRRWGAPWGAG